MFSTCWNKNIVILHLTGSCQIYQANKYLRIVQMRPLSVYHKYLHLFHNKLMRYIIRMVYIILMFGLIPFVSHVLC